MFATNKQITSLIDERIKYVREARANGLGDAEYFSKMESYIKGGFEKLKKQSTNKKLIAKYEQIINDTF